MSLTLIVRRTKDGRASVRVIHDDGTVDLRLLPDAAEVRDRGRLLVLRCVRCEATYRAPEMRLGADTAGPDDAFRAACADRASPGARCPSG